MLQKLMQELWDFVKCPMKVTYQGRGVARILLNKLKEEAHRLSLKELTTEASIMAMRLAKLKGYEVVQENRKVHHGVEFINYLMRKKL